MVYIKCTAEAERLCKVTNKGSGGERLMVHVYFMCISLAVNDKAKDFL